MIDREKLVRTLAWCTIAALSLAFDGLVYWLALPDDPACLVLLAIGSASTMLSIWFLSELGARVTARQDAKMLADHTHQGKPANDNDDKGSGRMKA